MTLKNFTICKLTKAAPFTEHAFYQRQQGAKMKTSLKIAALLMIAAPSIASAQNNNYQNIPGNSGGGSGMSNYNQQYFQQNPPPQVQPLQPGQGGAGASG